MTTLVGCWGGDSQRARRIQSVDDAARWLVVADSDACHYMISLLSPALPKPGR